MLKSSAFKLSFVIGGKNLTQKSEMVVKYKDILAFARCTKCLFCHSSLLSFLPFFQKQKLLQLFMILRTVWECCFTNTVSRSSLLRFISVIDTSCFPFPFERQSCWELLWCSSAVTGAVQWRTAVKPVVGWGLTSGTSQCLFCERTEFWRRFHMVSLQFGFWFFFLDSCKDEHPGGNFYYFFWRRSSPVSSYLKF